MIEGVRDGLEMKDLPPSHPLRDYKGEISLMSLVTTTQGQLILVNYDKIYPPPSPPGANCYMTCMDQTTRGQKGCIKRGETIISGVE